MTTQVQSIFSLKVRSKSMPLVNIAARSPHALKLKHYKSKIHEQQQQELDHSKRILDLETIKNKQTQQINTKIKILAERSMKKLQEKYDTIDRWKQKYVPQSSIILIRNKLSLDNHSIKINMQDNRHTSILQQHQLMQDCRQKNQLFPIIIKRQLAPMIPDQRQQGRRLQEMLKERLEKNKKYYELKSTIIEKQINYFQDINTFIAPQKKRQLQLRKLLLKSEKERVNNKGLFYKKLSLSQPKIKRQVRTKKRAVLQNVQRQRSKLNDDKEIQVKRSPTSIYDLKVKLMQEVVGATPQGWDTLNHLQSPEQQYLS